MYGVETERAVDKVLDRLSVRDRKRFLIIHKKVEEIRRNPFHKYTPLRAPLQTYRRVHIDSNFVLIFQVDHYRKKMVLCWYDHHDKVYKWRPK